MCDKERGIEGAFIKKKQHQNENRKRGGKGRVHKRKWSTEGKGNAQKRSFSRKHIIANHVYVRPSLKGSRE